MDTSSHEETNLRTSNTLQLARRIIRTDPLLPTTPRAVLVCFSGRGNNYQGLENLAMFSRTRRPSRKSRSRKVQFSERLSIESLERREMLAANLFSEIGQVLPLRTLDGYRPVASGSLTTDNTPVFGTVPAGFNFLHDNISSNTTGTFEVIPPTLGATFEGGVLTVTGSDEADNIFIFVQEGLVQVREVVKQLTLLSVPLADVQSIVVNANGGDDWVNIDDQSISIATTLRGDWGNDTLLGGAGPDNMFGATGNDELLGHAGNDLIHGDDGDDLLIGGDGDDVIHGGFGNDYLVGGQGDDWLLGEEGDDQMFGEAGNDMMFGGPGQNLMDGGAGDDQMYGGDDKDTMHGNEGNDFIRGLAGDDGLRGEAGNDIIMADDGVDLVDGGDGDDDMSGGAGNDVLSGGDGNDFITGGNDQDWLDGRAGDDVMDGGGGNDWVSGGAGTDQVNGGTGENQVYQAYPEGYVQYGVVQQSLSASDFGDFAQAVGEFIVGVFKWGLDKAETVGLRFYDWAAKIDDRLFQFTGDLAGALMNWPWEADFWKGMGRALVDALEVVGLAEAWDIASEILLPWQRGMTSTEIEVARSVYGDSIPWDRVRFDEYSLVVAAPLTRTHTIGYVINSWGDIDDRTMIHELTHVWQYVTDGLIYLPKVAPDALGENYEYGGVADLRAKMAAGKGFDDYNLEQQGEIVADYFMLRGQARQIEAGGGYAPLSMRAGPRRIHPLRQGGFHADS